MSQKSSCAIALVGIDIGKNSFHVEGHDRRGAIVAAVQQGTEERQRGKRSPRAKPTTAEHFSIASIQRLHRCAIEHRAKNHFQSFPRKVSWGYHIQFALAASSL